MDQGGEALILRRDQALHCRNGGVPGGKRVGDGFLLEERWNLDLKITDIITCNVWVFSATCRKSFPLVNVVVKVLNQIFRRDHSFIKRQGRNRLIDSCIFHQKTCPPNLVVTTVHGHKNGSGLKWLARSGCKSSDALVSSIDYAIRQIHGFYPWDCAILEEFFMTRTKRRAPRRYCCKILYAESLK